MPRFEGPQKLRKGTSLGTHVRSIWETLTCLIDEIPEVPDQRRARLRALRTSLEMAYPAILQVHESDLAHEYSDADIPEDI